MRSATAAKDFFSLMKRQPIFANNQERDGMFEPANGNDSSELFVASSCAPITLRNSIPAKTSSNCVTVAEEFSGFDKMVSERVGNYDDSRLL